MRLLIVFGFLLYGTPAFAEVFLCGDSPPVADSSLKGDIEGKAKLLSKLLGDASLRGEIEISRKEIFSKYPNADRLVIDYYLLYQACLILMQDETLDITEKLKELRAMRIEFHDTFKSQNIVKACRHPDFGQEGWLRSEVIVGSSGWVGGGSNPRNWCNSLINRTIQGRNIGPSHKAEVINTSEQSKKDWKGHVEYNYHCKVLLEWEPLYFEKVDPRCDTVE